VLGALIVGIVGWLLGLLVPDGNHKSTPQPPQQRQVY
jgi:hypothetical protein